MCEFVSKNIYELTVYQFVLFQVLGTKGGVSTVKAIVPTTSKQNR